MTNSSPSPDIKGWATVAAAALLCVIGLQISLPGLDSVVVAQWQSRATLAAPYLGGTLVPILGTGVGAFILIRMLLAFSRPKDPNARRFAVVMYLVLTAGVGLAVATGLESMRIGMATVVIEPGWSFRLMAIGTQLAGAAIIWWLADRVSETGLTSGTLIIYGTFHVLALGVAILDGGESLAVAEFGGAFALVPAFAATLVLLVAGMTGPPSLQLRPGAELRSTLDLALVPVAAWGITRAFVSQSPIPQEMVAAAASLFVTLGLVAWCVSHRRGLRVGPLLLSPLPAIVGGLFAFGGMALAPGGLDALLAPSPFHGDVTATVVVEAAEPGPDDAEILADRLEALEIDATVRGSGGRVELDLRGVVGVPEVLDAVLPRRFLSLHEVVEEGDTRRPAAVLQACHYPDRPADCEPYPILEAQLSSTDISRADVRLGEYGNTFVLVSFTPDGGQRFGDMTAAMVGRRLAIAIDGEVMSVPVVRQAIRGGRAHIEVSHPKSVAREAEALAAAMRSRPMQGAWTLAEIKAP